jgi:RNA polymerase sigma-70 factor (ECF subfamily)
MPDSELVCGILEGRIDFAELLRRFERGVYRRMYALVKNAADAEELTECVFVRVFEQLRSYDPVRGSFCRWLYSIAYNVAMSHFRTRRRAPLSLDIMTESEAPSVAGPADLHEANERRTRLLQSVAELDPVDRGVLFGFHVYDQSWEEVAAEQGCTERHARYRSLVVLKKLRESL